MDSGIIAKLEGLFFQGFTEKEFEVGGYKWKMRTLNESESVWRDKFIQLSVASSFLSAKRVPTLAIAIKEIDGEDIVDIFKVGKKTTAKTLAEEFVNDEFSGSEFKAAEKLREFLGKLPTQVIDRLYSNFMSLEKEAEKALQGVLGEPEFFRGDEKEEPSSNGEDGSNDKDGDASKREKV